MYVVCVPCPCQNSTDGTTNPLVVVLVCPRDNPQPTKRNGTHSNFGRRRRSKKQKKNRLEKDVSIEGGCSCCEPKDRGTRRGGGEAGGGGGGGTGRRRGTFSFNHAGLSPVQYCVRGVKKGVVLTTSATTSSRRQFDLIRYSKAKVSSASPSLSSNSSNSEFGIYA